MRRDRILLALLLLLHVVYFSRKEAEQWFIWPDGDFARAVGPIWYWAPLLALAWLWCGTNAAYRHVKLSVGGALLAGVLFPIGVPYYFLKTYDKAQAIRQIGWFVAFACACVALGALSGWTTHKYYAVWSNT